MNAVIVDTSSWIHYFKDRDYPEIDSALSNGHLYLPPIVAAELTSGQLSPSKRAALVDFLRDLPLIEVTFDHWIRVGELRQKAAHKGLPVSTSDAHIAQCCLDFDACLITEDKIFKKIKLAMPQLGLKITSS